MNAVYEEGEPGNVRERSDWPVCGHRFLSVCVREKGHEPPHRDASGNEWRGVEVRATASIYFSTQER